MVINHLPLTNWDDPPTKKAHPHQGNPGTNRPFSHENTKLASPESAQQIPALQRQGWMIEWRIKGGRHFFTNWNCPENLGWFQQIFRISTGQKSKFTNFEKNSERWEYIPQTVTTLGRRTSRFLAIFVMEKVVVDLVDLQQTSNIGHS